MGAMIACINGKWFDTSDFTVGFSVVYLAGKVWLVDFLLVSFFAGIAKDTCTELQQLDGGIPKTIVLFMQATN